MFKNKKIAFSIRNRLIISFLAILIIPTSAIGWFSYQSAAQEVSKQIEENARQNVLNVDNQITDLINSTIADSEYMAKAVKGSQLDGKENPALRQVLDPLKAVKPGLDNFFYGTESGLFFTSPAKKMADGFDPRTRAWYPAAMAAKGQSIVNNPMISADEKKSVIVITSRATEDGSGVVGTTLNLDQLAEQINKIKVGKNGYITIMDKSHKYVTHPTIAAGVENVESFIHLFYDQDAATVNYFFKGADKRAVFVTNKLTGWKILGAIQLTEIADATRNILISTLIVIGISILLGVLLVIWIVRSITSPLKQLTGATERIANGDLTEEIEIRSKDEIGQLSGSVNNMVHKLRHLIGNVISSAQNVAAASQQISATTEEIAGGSSAQAQAAQDMQERFGELSVAISSVATSADEAANLAAKTTSIAHDGGEIVQKSVASMNQVNAQMSRLEDDSNKIGEIIEVIDDIAEQTNLLALNAAIEAARAGEQGRGFAVVADEVRKLAERSGEATKQITSIIKGMQENTHRSVLAVSEGVAQSQETGDAFGKIIDMINETEHKVGEIAAASEEQSAQSEEVMRSIESISSASEEAAAASEETAATSQTLAQLAEGLNDAVSIFKIR